MKVLVCGGRNYADAGRVDGILAVLQPSRIIHGGATGADTLAGQWADRNRVPVWVFHADWEAHGKSAGPIRNARMLTESQPDVVVAFPGGRGTQNMISLAVRAGVRTIVVEDDKVIMAAGGGEAS